MADETAAEQDQRLAASIEASEIPEDTQRLSEQILAEIRAADARDDKRIRDWISGPQNPDFGLDPDQQLGQYTELLAESRPAEAERTELRPQQGNEVEQFLQRERAQIEEFRSVGSQVDPQDVPVFEAYLNGRRDTYNGFREQLVAANPSLSADLPASIELDEIRIQQQVVGQEEKQDQSLSLAQ